MIENSPNLPAQDGEIALDGDPYTFDIDAKVVVCEHISHRYDLSPRDFGMGFFKLKKDATSGPPMSSMWWMTHVWVGS